MITTAHPARRHRRANPRGGRRDHGRQHRQAHRRRDPVGRDQRVRLVDVGDLRREVVDERDGAAGSSNTAAAAATAVTASRNQRRRTTAADRAADDHHHAEDLPEQDHPGDEPRRQRLDAPDQVGDEPDDGLVEQRTDDHDDQSDAAATASRRTSVGALAVRLGSDEMISTVQACATSWPLAPTSDAPTAAPITGAAGRGRRRRAGRRRGRR